MKFPDIYGRIVAVIQHIYGVCYNTWSMDLEALSSMNFYMLMHIALKYIYF